MSDNLTGASGTLSVEADTSRAVGPMNAAGQTALKMGEDMAKGGAKGEKALDELAKATEDRAKRMEAADKRATQVLMADSRERVKQLQKEIEETRNARKQEDTKQTEAKQTGTLAAIKERGTQSVKVLEEKRTNNQLVTLGRQAVARTEAEEKRKTALTREAIRERRALRSNEATEEKRVQAIIDRTTLAPAGTRERVIRAIGGEQMRRRRDAMVAFGGLTNRQALHSQLSGSFGADEAAFLSGFSGTRPFSLGGKDVEGMKAAQEAARDAKKANADYNRRLKEIQRQVDKESAEIAKVIRRSLNAPAEIQQKILAAIGGAGPTAQRRQMMAQGATMSQVLNQQLSGSIGQTNAAWLVGGGGRRPTMFGGTPPGGGGRGGGGGNIFTRLLGGGGGGIAGGIASGLLGGLGVGVGGYALAGAMRGVGEDIERATAYERQTVAARNLAGSQAKLNELLTAYATASGNAVDKVTTLSNVTRLMATGFAESAPEIEKFVRATRGASIALGKPQDYVIQETQLAISNTSVKRLDQIGLGITEVNERIEELRDTNANWTREMAFQDGVLSLLDEKYGKLTTTAEGQATGIEKLRKAWSDLRLEIGKGAKVPADSAAGWLAGLIGNINADELSNLFTTGGIVPANVTKRFRSAQDFVFTDDSQSYVSPPRPKGPTDEQEALRSSYFKQFSDMEAEYSRQRLAETERYESQRLSIIQNYGKMLVREEQDFALQRARGLEDYERSIMGIMRDAQEREESMREDLADKIADARENHEEAVSEIQEKYLKDREKAQSDHLDRMMKAAGQLDAIALLEERKRWRKENEEREEGHKEALEQEDEKLQEQIEEAQKAHDKRLEDAREADRKRLADMAESRRIQLAREDEDRGIRLVRAAEDHAAQLAEMDRLHAETMTKLAAEYTAQRLLMEEEFALAMHNAGVYVEGVAAKLVAKQKLEEEWLDEMIMKYENRLRIESEPNPYSYDPTAGPNIPTDYGSRLIETAPVSSSSVSNSSRSLVVNQGAIQIYPVPGQSAGDIATEVERIVVDLMEAY